MVAHGVPVSTPLTKCPSRMIFFYYFILTSGQVHVLGNVFILGEGERYLAICVESSAAIFLSAVLPEHVDRSTLLSRQKSCASNHGRREERYCAYYLCCEMGRC